MIRKTPFYSCRLGFLPKGCRLCVQGKKTVLFITGICSKHCFFCPISDMKYGKDVIYANEWNISRFGELVREIELCDSKGVGITGGDPLCRLERTAAFIKKLKKRFGKSFHIHLYTPLNLVDDNSLKLLFSSGLDEIRFHPDMHKENEWKRIELALPFNWDVGVEIPVIPGEIIMVKRLINYITKLNINFLNLNELEISDTNAQHLIDRKFKPKNNISYGVKGSWKLAKELLRYCNKNTNLNVHYCTTTLKDKIQLAKRIKRRCKNVRKPFDKVTREGLLVRGAAYLPALVPSFNYKNKIKGIENKSEILAELRKIRFELIRKYRIKAELIEVDEGRLRLLTTSSIAKSLKEKSLKTAIVTEYPTHDCFPVELDFL